MERKTFKDFLSEEGRRTDLTYKEEKTKGALTKVIVTLEGTESAEATKLAKRFDQIKKALVRLEAAHKEINKTLTAKALTLFDDAADKIATRVVKTASFAITIAKHTEPTEKQEVNYEELYADVAKLLDDSLKPQLDALIEKHTKKWVPELRKPSASVKAIEEGIMSAAKNKLSDLLAKIEEQMTAFVVKLTQWGKGYDRELASLQAKL